MELIRINNPFQREDRDIVLIPHTNISIEEIMIDHLDYVKEIHGLEISLVDSRDIIRVSINGNIIPPEFWYSTKPMENDQIVFMPIVVGGGGGDNKNILNAVIMIAVVVALGPAGIGLIGAGASIGSTVLGMAIIAGTGMILQSMTPMPQMKGLNANADDWEASQTYSWNPITTQKQGIIRPKFYGKNKLYGNVFAVHTEVNDTDDSKQILKMLIGLGGGPVQGIIDGSIKINDQPITNYSGVSTEERLGLIDQTAISFFGETKPEYRPNRLVSSGSSITYTTPDSDFDDLEIELLFPRGLYFANDQGSLSSHIVGIKIEISVADAASWSTLAEESLTSNLTSPKRKSYSASGTHAGGSPVTITNGVKYDIRVTKTSSDETSSRFGDELRLSSIREVLNDDFEYPMTSILGIEALATDQLSGSLSVSCIQEGAIVNVFDGASWSLEYSTNPAWILFDILTQPIISGDGQSGTPYVVERYEGTNPSNMDIVKFFELAQFCDQADIPDGEGGIEKRVTFNGGFDIETTPWEAALKVSEIARCMPIWTGSKLTLAIDKTDDPVQMFNVSDIEEDSFKETFLPQEELVSEIEVQYRDEKQDFKRVPFTILEDNITNTTRRLTLDLIGITKQSEAWRAGMLRLSQNRYLKSSVEFMANIDAVQSTIGNVIWVQHDVPLWGEGGRVVSGTTLSIVVDKDMEYFSDSQHEVLVRKSDDTINQRTTTSKYNPVIGGNQGSKQFTITGNFANEYLEDDSIKVIDSEDSARGNEGTYTLATGATFGGGVTTITVNEVLPSSAFDGGLYNLRRVVVSSVFKDEDDVTEAPAAGDIYTFGIQDLHARKYRIKNMSKSSNQYVTINAIEYNALAYGFDSDVPIIALEEGITPPDSDNVIPVVLNPSWGDVERRYPKDVTIGPPNLDTLQMTNLVFSNDVPNLQVTWVEGILSYKGAVYAISSDVSGTNKYIYWDVSDNPTTLLTTNVQSEAVGAGKFILCVNNSGVAFPIAVGFPYWGELLVAETLSALTAQLGDVLAGSLTGTTITGGLIRTALSGRRIQMDSDGMRFLTGTVGGTARNIIAGILNRSDITNITNDAQAVVSVPGHDFIQGDTIRFDDVIGMEEINFSNAGYLSIVNTDSNGVDVTVNFDASASGMGAYSSGGTLTAGSGQVSGGGILARFYNLINGIPFSVISEQTVADIHLFDRANTPSGVATKGDICSVNQELQECTESGTPGTWQKVNR